MLKDVFYWVLNMSITASVTGLIVMLLRRIRRLPRRVTVWLWLIPFVRMAVPVGLNSPFSLMSLIARLFTKTVVVYQPTDGVAFSMTNCVTAADSYFPITYKTDLLDGVFSVAAIVWLLVLAAVAVMMTVSYVTTLRSIKDAVLQRDNVYRSETIRTPAVYGILRPKIVLPASTDAQDAALILLHERMHIRSCDNLRRLLAFAVAAVHWFNPLARLFLKAFLEDLELACDERVLSVIGTERAKDYARVLLEARQSATALTSCFGGTHLRTRIVRILSFRRLTWLSLAGTALLTVVMFCVLLTNAG